MDAINSISANFAKHHDVAANGTQSRIKFNHELYDLRARISSCLFLIRSLLDQFSALIQFLSGPHSNQYSSFSDVATKATKRPAPPELDDELCDYLANHLEWYWKLKDFRDYIAHHGFVPLRLIETEPGKIEVYLHHRVGLIELIEEFRFGLDNLLNFLDIHFSKRINKKA